MKKPRNQKVTRPEGKIDNRYLISMGQFLRRYREKRNVTMMDITNTKVLSESGVSLNERRHGNVNISVVEAYSEYFKMPVWKFFQLAEKEYLTNNA